jgi:hypothetical protein
MYDDEVTITWLDGTQEMYPCHSWRVDDGVLYLTQRMYSEQPKRAFPVSNIRTWTSRNR